MNDAEFNLFLEMATRLDAGQAQEFFQKMAERYWADIPILENMNAAEISRKLTTVSELIKNRTGE
jgi:hypothetical protein